MSGTRAGKWDAYIPLWKRQHEEGMSYRQIAVQSDANYGAVQRALYTVESGSKWMHHADEWRRRYEDEGQTLEEIARDFKPCDKTIGRTLQAIGVELRAPGTRPGKDSDRSMLEVLHVLNSVNHRLRFGDIKSRLTVSARGLESVLARLERSGRVESSLEGSRRRLYGITDAGREIVKVEPVPGIIGSMDA